MSDIRKIILEQRQSPGDGLTASRAIYDLCRAYPDWEIDIQSPFNEVYEGNPFTTSLDKSSPGVERYNLTYDDINDSGWKGSHFADAFRNDIERKLNSTRIFSFSIPLPAINDLGKVKEYVKAGFIKEWWPCSDEMVVQVITEPKLENYSHCWHVYDGATLYELRGKTAKATVEVEAYWFWKDELEKVIVPSTGILPEIYFSDEELSWYNQVHCTFFWDGPFWLLNAGRKSDNALKQYHRWQEVVDILNDAWDGKVRIVQIGSQSAGGMEHIHPELAGVFNLVGKTSLRELLRLGYWSTGLLGSISLQFVIGAALDKPCVVVAGGKEGMRWHVYNHVQWIKKNGCLPCAMSDGCWLGGTKGKCKNLVVPDDMEEPVPLCFEITSPEEIADAVFDYYNGGRLELPEEELWHIPEGEDRAALIAKYDGCYKEGGFPK